MLRLLIAESGVDRQQKKKRKESEGVLLLLKSDTLVISQGFLYLLLQQAPPLQYDAFEEKIFRKANGQDASGATGMTWEEVSEGSAQSEALSREHRSNDATASNTPNSTRLMH